MTATTKRKILSKTLRGSSAALAAGVPIWLIVQKFPIWVVEQEPEVSLTGGGIAIVLIAILAFRRKISGAVKPVIEGMKNRGGVVLGTVLLSAFVLGVCALVRKVYPIVPDIETICAGGVVSGLAGVGLDATAMAVSAKNDKEKIKTGQEATDQAVKEA